MADIRVWAKIREGGKVRWVPTKKGIMLRLETLKGLIPALVKIRKIELDRIQDLVR